MWPNINMTNSSHTCPAGLKLLTTPKRLCAMNIGGLAAPLQPSAFMVYDIHVSVARLSATSRDHQMHLGPILTIIAISQLMTIM